MPKTKRALFFLHLLLFLAACLPQARLLAVSTVAERQVAVDGLAVSVRYGADVTTTFGYDGLRRRVSAMALSTIACNFAELSGIGYSDATPDISYAYNRVGKLSQVTDAAGTRTFAYNSAFDEVSETVTGLYSKTLTRAYTSTGFKGKKQGLSIGNVSHYSYGYDTYGRMNQITIPSVGMLRDATSRCWSVSRNRTTRGGTGRRPPRLRDYENEDRILKKLEIQTIQLDKETEQMIRHWRRHKDVLEVIRQLLMLV